MKYVIIGLGLILIFYAVVKLQPEPQMLIAVGSLGVAFSSIGFTEIRRQRDLKLLQSISERLDKIGSAVASKVGQDSAEVKSNSTLGDIIKLLTVVDHIINEKRKE